VLDAAAVAVRISWAGPGAVDEDQQAEPAKIGGFWLYGLYIGDGWPVI
jgi:hypothetical protein